MISTFRRRLRIRHWLTAALIVHATTFAQSPQPAKAPADPFRWPDIKREQKPWSYWWWMGSAVDTNNLTRELTRYRDAGMGGVHIIPIYGAKGWETNYIPYLSPRWMAMLAHTVREAKRLGLGVDMTTGTGWCFGGPRVTDEEANASVVWKTYDVEAGASLNEKFDTAVTQALVAFGPNGKVVELTERIGSDGSVNWTAAGGSWRVFAVSQKPSGQKVKRPALGGEGHMLNLASPPAMTNFLDWFNEAFAKYRGPKPRAQYHDSYEYRCDWSPELFAEFEQRRGYRLQDELPALFGVETNADRVARVKCDYRETFSDIMIEETLPMWADWSRRKGFLTRNEAHGSPGNWLDLYAVADMPETEMFYRDRNKLISKFASSAAHTQGKPLVSCETGTWLNEHFTETLADMKYLLDDLFLSGVNHIFYHGTCYSPDEAGWPGWVFYASYEMNPRNSIWRDVPALNAYAARCQAVLQSGRPDNDLLLYWPVHDFWNSPTGMVRNLTVHARDWFEAQPVGHAAEELWRRGYAFDYVSDRQLARAKTSTARGTRGAIALAGGNYAAIVVPECKRMPLATLSNLLALANSGATVIFEGGLPGDVPGWGKLNERRATLAELRERIPLTPTAEAGVGEGRVGRGRILVGNLTAALKLAGVPREPMFDQPGLMCVRRAIPGGHYYFIANRTPDQSVDGWIELGRQARSALVMDPLTGATGVAPLRQSDSGRPELLLKLAPGQSVIVRCLDKSAPRGKPWPYWVAESPPVALSGDWNVNFIAGGPELPTPFSTSRLASWTTLGDTNAQRFAGTARYTLEFDAPPHTSGPWLLDLGDVRQSARVRLNGRDLGTLITPPFRVVVDSLKPSGNKLEIEVTNVSANRIRDLDRRGEKWKNFHDINFVNINYRPFDASNWPLAESGLLGPVTLSPAEATGARGETR